MTEEEESGNLLDGFSISGISKSIGGSSRIIKIVLLLVVIGIIFYMLKKMKVFK